MIQRYTSKKLKLTVIAALVLAGGVSFARISASAQAPQKQIEIVGRDASLAERVGPDDGAAFIVQFIGDVHGSLDSCG